MSDRRRFRPRWETMEGRALLSGLGATARPSAAIRLEADRAVTVRLSGSFLGEYTPDLGAPVLTLAGNGRVDRVGAATLSGTVEPFTTTPSGRPAGVVEINTPRGKIRVELSASRPVTGGPIGIPLTIRSFAARIVGGDGAYARASGRGSAVLILNEAGAFAIGFRPTIRR